MQRRRARSGMALIATLVMVLVIAGLVALVQTRATANQVLLSRLAATQRTALAEEAVFARARLLVADRLTSETGPLPLDGTPVMLAEDGQTIALAVQDVGGLVNLWFASADVLALLPGLPDGIVDRRAELVAARGSGAAALVAEQLLAQLGLKHVDRVRLMPLVTLQGTAPGINPDVVPDPLRAQVGGLDASLLRGGQAQTVRVAVSGSQ